MSVTHACNHVISHIYHRFKQEVSEYNKVLAFQGYGDYPQHERYSIDRM